MGHWNYRAVKKMVGGDAEFGIYSVYYDDEGQANGVSVEPANVMCYSNEDLAATLELMQECLKQPTLIWEEIESSD